MDELHMPHVLGSREATHWTSPSVVACGFGAVFCCVSLFPPEIPHDMESRLHFKSSKPCQKNWEKKIPSQNLLKKRSHTENPTLVGGFNPSQKY